MKKCAFICAAAIAISAIAPTGTSAMTQRNGVLTWDFEGLDDVAYYKYIGEKNDISHTETDESLVWVQYVDRFDSGSWVKACQAADPYWMQPKRIKNVVGAKPDAFADDEYSNNGLPIKNEYGGDYVMQMSGDKTERAVGMSIKLSDKDIVPGRKYKLAFSAITDQTWEQPMIAGFGKPSERPVTRDEMNSMCEASKVVQLQGSNKELVPITEENKNQLRQVKFPGCYTASAPSSKVDENKAGSGSWANGYVELVASEDLFEDGYIALHVCTMGKLWGYSGGQYNSIYIDDLYLEPLEGERVTGKTSAHKLEYGKIWNFEGEGIARETAVDGTDLMTAPGSFEDGEWAPLHDAYINDKFRDVRQFTVAEASADPMRDKDGNATQADHSVGRGATGSTKCVRIASPDSWSTEDRIGGTWYSGMRVKVNKSDFVSLDNLKIDLSVMKNSHHKRRLWLMVMPTTDPAPVTQFQPWSYNEATYPWLAAATKKIDLGLIDKGWQSKSAAFSLSDSDFDENGEATFALIISPNTYLNEGNADITSEQAKEGINFGLNEHFYFDDISVTVQNADPWLDELTGDLILTTTNDYESYDSYDGYNLLTIAAAYDDNGRLMWTELVDGKAKYVDVRTFDMTGKMDGVSSLKLFVWNGTELRPAIDGHPIEPAF